MLTKVVIKSFRSCQDVTIDAIGPSLVLVGRNGSGKTNILRAIQWAAETAISHEPVAGPFGDARAVTLEFRAGEAEYRYELEVVAGGFDPGASPPFSISRLIESLKASVEPGRWEDLASRDETRVHLPDLELALAPTTPLLSLALAYLRPDHPARDRLRSVADFLARVKYYAFDEPSQTQEGRHPITDAELKTFMADPARHSGEPGTAVTMMLLDLLDRDPASFAEVGSLLGDDGLGMVCKVVVHSYDRQGTDQADRFSIYHDVFFRMAHRNSVGGSMLFTFPELSLGTRRVIRLIVSMIHDQGSVMLIEHPEDGLHPGLTRKVFSLLQTYADPTQIIVTSHSSHVLDMLRPEQLRLVTMVEGGTEVRALSAKEVELARAYLDEEGSLSEFLQLLGE